jgi:hypothetical protein
VCNKSLATRFELDGPEIESRYRRDIEVNQTDPRLTQSPVSGHFPGSKRQGHGADHLPPSCAFVKEE